MSDPIRCTRCAARLNENDAVWLSFNCRTQLYQVEPVGNPADDQGGHPFGKACARKQLKEDAR